MAQGLKADYLVSGYGTFGMTEDGQSKKKLLLMDINQVVRSSLSVDLDAKNVKFIIHTSNGKIIKAVVPNFEAMTRNGVLQVIMQNTGQIQASYSVTVTECSANINPILSQQVLVSAQQIYTLSFAITTATEIQQSNTCMVRLYDAVHALRDSLLVKFDTSETTKSSGDKPVDDTGVIEENAGNSGSGSSNPFSALFGSCEKCAWYDLICKIVALCLKDLLLIVGLVVFLVGLLIFLIVFTYLGGWKWVAFCCKICKCCCQGMLAQRPSLPKFEKRKKDRHVTINSNSNVLDANEEQFFPEQPHNIAEHGESNKMRKIETIFQALQNSTCMKVCFLNICKKKTATLYKHVSQQHLQRPVHPNRFTIQGYLCAVGATCKRSNARLVRQLSNHPNRVRFAFSMHPCQQSQEWSKPNYTGCAIVELHSLDIQITYSQLVLCLSVDAPKYHLVNAPF